MHGASGPLVTEMSYLLVCSIASAWITWMWTQEEMFEDMQGVLKRLMTRCEQRLKNLANSYPPGYNGTRTFFQMFWAHVVMWVDAAATWTIHKIWFILSSSTAFIHIPAICFILYRNDHLVDKGWLGLVYAWLFTAFSADAEIALLRFIKTTMKLEVSTERAISAGAVLLEQKIKNPNEIGPVSVQSRRGSVAIGSPADNFPNLPQNVPVPLHNEIPIPRNFAVAPTASRIIIPGGTPK